MNSQSFRGLGDVAPQSVSTRWICSHSTRAKDGVSGGPASLAGVLGSSRVAPVERGDHLVHVRRLGQVVRRAEPHGFERRRDASIAGQHDDLGRRVDSMQLAHEL